MISIKSQDTEETEGIGILIGKELCPGDVIALEGDLGAGKTVLTRGIARGLCIEDHITSPTFTLINEYRGRLPLYHFDVYRLDNPEDLEDLGYEDYFYGEGVTVIEWGDKVKEMLPETYLCIKMIVEEDGRVLEFHPHGERYVCLVERIREIAGIGD